MSLKKITLSVVALLLLSASTMHAQTKLLDKLKKFAGPSDELIKMDSKGNYYLEDNGTVFFAYNKKQNCVIHFNEKDFYTFVRVIKFVCKSTTIGLYCY